MSKKPFTIPLFDGNITNPNFRQSTYAVSCMMILGTIIENITTPDDFFGENGELYTVIKLTLFKDNSIKNNNLLQQIRAYMIVYRENIIKKFILYEGKQITDIYFDIKNPDKYSLKISPNSQNNVFTLDVSNGSFINGFNDNKFIENILLNLFKADVSSTPTYFLNYLFLTNILNINSCTLINLTHSSEYVNIMYVNKEINDFVKTIPQTDYIILTLDKFNIISPNHFLGIPNYKHYCYILERDNKYYTTYVDVSEMFTCDTHKELFTVYNYKEDGKIYFENLLDIICGPTNKGSIITMVYHRKDLNNYSATLKEFIDNVNKSGLIQ